MYFGKQKARSSYSMTLRTSNYEFTPYPDLISQYFHAPLMRFGIDFGSEDPATEAQARKNLSKSAYYRVSRDTS